jgi:multidrug efflux pump subunit AcrA (membrane-fusion protein)
MSDQSIDPGEIERTKQQIRGLVNEIAQLTKSGVAPGEFYGQFLPRVVTALAAVGGAVWAVNGEGQLALQYQMNLAETKLIEQEDERRRHGQLLHKVLQSGEGSLVPPHSGSGDEAEAANSSNYLLVLSPLKTDTTTEGVVEIFQRPDAGPNTQKGYLRFLLQMCELAGDFLKTNQLRHFTDRQAMWSQLEEFTRVVHSSLEPKQTAYIIANEGRRLIDCDRVSVAIRKGGRCIVTAVSGQDLFDKRSNTIRMLNRLASEVVAADETIWYTGDTTKMAPQIEEAVQEYIDEVHTKTLAILPLKRERVALSDTKEDRAEAEEQPFGALIVERIEDANVPPALVHRVEVVAKHSAAALANSLEHDTLFLMPVWRTIGKSRLLVNARNLPKTISISAGVVAVLLFLILWPADFNLAAKGSLEPVLRSDVYARIDGVVEKLLVDHGDVVHAGQVLCVLRNTELGVQLAEVKGQLAATEQRMNSIDRMLLEDNRDSRTTAEERERMKGEFLELKAKFEDLERQKALYEEKEQDLEVKSPMEGKVITWDLRNRLKQRPVQRGQVLMRIAEPDKEWQIELRMAEDRMGYIVKAQQALFADYQGALPVKFILATEPGTSRMGTIKEMHLAAEIQGDEGSTVLIKVRIDKSQLPPIRPGTQVSAKVYCGRRAIGFVWFHDLVSFIESRVLFRIF